LLDCSGFGVEVAEVKHIYEIVHVSDDAYYTIGLYDELGAATIKIVKESAYPGQSCYWIRTDNAIPGYMCREAIVPESELEAVE
jgi:hypothetical protein